MGKPENDYISCSNCKTEFDWKNTKETKMGYVDCPKCGYWVDQTGKTFKKENKNEKSI